MIAEDPTYIEWATENVEYFHLDRQAANALHDALTTYFDDPLLVDPFMEGPPEWYDEPPY